MIEKYFPTKNCRSAKKIAQLRQVLKSNGSATFVVEMYITAPKSTLSNYKDIICLTYFWCIFPIRRHQIYVKIRY